MSAETVAVAGHGDALQRLVTVTEVAVVTETVTVAVTGTVHGRRASRW